MTPHRARTLIKSQALLRAQIALTLYAVDPDDLDRIRPILDRLFEIGARNPKLPPRPYRKNSLSVTRD
jgi:hypothetical protein